MSTPGQTPLTPNIGGGLITEAIRLFGSFSRHLQALGSLAGIEGKHAVGLYVRLIVMLIGGLIFAVFGYIFVILTIAFLIAWLFNVAWMWIALGFAVLHFLFAFLCATHVRTHFRTPIFADTAAEIRKDLALLNQPENSHPPLP